MACLMDLGSPQERRNRLRLMSEQVLDATQAPNQVLPIAEELITLMSGLGTVVRQAEGLNQGEVMTPNGLAVSPRVAAMCAQGDLRTIQYLRGVHEAILAVRTRNPERPVRVLYAGCGPYATLATPLMALFSPHEVQFTLLDFHPDAIASVHEVLHNLGVADRVVHLEAGDATSYQIDAALPPDVIMMEIMLAGLEIEPQVAITRHLLSQAPEAVLIPEEVSIDLAWVDPTQEFAQRPLVDKRQSRVDAGCVFKLDRHAVRAWAEELGGVLPGERIAIPAGIEPWHHPMWLTRIKLFGGHRLEEYESGLTSPRGADIAVPKGKGGEIEIAYRLGEWPGLVQV